jgi:DNA helicase-2/ATP-dependent DNA helicase PcrA
MILTKNQRLAVEHPGHNLQLIACAGSGKTEVVARRVVHLLTPRRSDSLLPANIIAFTFTEKAAAELKERIVTRTREALGDLPGMAEMFVGTIHAFGLELLKSETPKYKRYVVLNEIQQGLFVDRHSKRSGLSTSCDLKGTALKRYRDTKHYLDALAILREAELDDAQLKGCSLLNGLDAYRDLLEDRSYLDYSSILEATVDALTNDDGLRARLRDRVKYVIVDEYQDVNPVQEAIIWSLHELGARVCVVGDDDQAIYQWRSTDVENILTFAKRYPRVDLIPLEENFRSSDGIVETARVFIEQNVVRLSKAMKPTGAQATEPGDIIALAFATPEEEAQYIVTTVQSLRGVAFREDQVERGLSWSDMAVLFRSVKANAEPVTDAMQAAGIPFIVTGMTSLFNTAEAEAARQLFYFIGDLNGVDNAAVEQIWTAANLGLDPAELRSAIQGAVLAKTALSDPEQKRWGQYSIQRVFLDFLEKAGISEERVPNGRGEVVFYNLGKFSQVISDFEAIHFHSKPAEKYASFANFLQFRAEDAYPEGWQNNQYANPDAVRIMTIHQAKGMQWPVAFVPALLKNRFPAKKPGGRNVWNLIPREGVRGQARFEGTIEDERRLFYVAMTRSMKFLHLTWAPVPGNRLFQTRSPFWDDILASRHVKRRAPNYSTRRHIPPAPRAGVSNVIFSFSDLKYFFECPYQFKLRALYGFNAPIHEALGYGKSLHDALAEVHARAIQGDIAEPAEVPRLVETHLHTPYAYPALRQELEASAEQVLFDYLADNTADFNKVEFSEKLVEINLGGGVSVVGRIDLVRRIDTGETTIVDLKSTNRAQAEEVTETQLHIYALGFQELTGRRPDYVEIYELDERKRKPRAVDDDFIADVITKTREAAVALRTSVLPAVSAAEKCTGCDYRGMCTAGRAAAEAKKRGARQHDTITKKSKGRA